MALGSARITIVGCGPGSRSALTVEAIAAIGAAQIVLGPAHLLAVTADLTTARTIEISGDPRAAIGVIEALAPAPVTVLVTGDPGVASLARPLIRHFGRARCHVVAGLSSVQIACARLALDWTACRIINAHSAAPTVDPSSLRDARVLCVLAGNDACLPWLASLANVLGPAWRIYAASDLTLPTERVVELTAPALAHSRFPSRTVFVFAHEESL